VWSAGTVGNGAIDLARILHESDHGPVSTAREIADAVLTEAIQLDQGRPRDDATVVVIKVVQPATLDNIRRLTMRLPI
jgi:serine phosphatase RsbU (regulator of sigma subunit)